MAVVEGVLKTMALPVVGAVVGLAYVTGWGPYGLTKPMPECGEAPPCIIVTGLDGDVRYIPSGADASLVDLNDEAVTRLVVWLREELPLLDADQAAHAQRAAAAVLKYPRRIAMGEPGTPNELDVRRQALEQAVSLGQRFGADLVVIGGVDGDTYEIAFIDPAAPPPQLTLTRFASDGARAPASLGRALRDALGPIALAPATPEVPPPTPRETVAVRPPAQSVTTAALAQPAPAAVQTARSPTPAAAPVRSAPVRSPTSPAAPAPPQLAPLPPPQWQTPPSNPVVDNRAPVRAAPPARAQSVASEDIVRRAQGASVPYPERAAERGREGVVRLRCVVRGDGGADCEVFSEDPSGWGFGTAALRAARSIQVRTTNASGQSTVGVTFYETVRFTLNEAGGR